MHHKIFWEFTDFFTAYHVPQPNCAVSISADKACAIWTELHKIDTIRMFASEYMSHLSMCDIPYIDGTIFRVIFMPVINIGSIPTCKEVCGRRVCHREPIRLRNLQFGYRFTLSKLPQKKHISPEGLIRRFRWETGDTEFSYVGYKNGIGLTAWFNVDTLRAMTCNVP